MPKKIYTIENLDCANCAAKAEAKIRQVAGVEDAAIIFATMQLHLTAEDPDALLDAVLAAARQVEADIRFLPREGDHHQHHHEDCGHHHEHHEGCGCGHEHHHHGGCCCGHDHGGDNCSCGHGHHEEEPHHHHEEGKQELQAIVLGGALFVVGLLLEHLLPSIPLHIAAFVAAYLVLGWDVLNTARKNLVRGKVFDENFLMSLATLGAFAIGEFPEAVGVMLFYRVGEYFEHRAVARSRSAIMEAVDLRPETVTLASGEVIAAAAAKVGDLLLVRPGDRIPLDGVVVEGVSRVDTAPITGESVPVGVKAGDAVISGCVNVSGQLLVKVEKMLGDSMVTRILNSVENAAAGKPKLDRFITRFARIYTPAVVLTAILTAIVPSLLTGEWEKWLYTALNFLMISCPCALVLSVPLAFFSGIGAGSRKGILFKDGISLEVLTKVRAVVMDKTGTLTNGSFHTGLGCCRLHDDLFSLLCFMGTDSTGWAIDDSFGEFVYIVSHINLHRVFATEITAQCKSTLTFTSGREHRIAVPCRCIPFRFDIPQTASGIVGYFFNIQICLFLFRKHHNIIGIQKLALFPILVTKIEIELF